MIFSDKTPRRRPLPAIDVELDRAVPAWLLRVLAGCVLIVGIGPVLDNWPITIAAAILVVALPQPGVVAGLTLLAAWWYLLQEPRMLTAALLTLVLHLVLVLSRLVSSIGPLGRVELRLVVRALGTFVVIQLLAQALLGLALAAMVGMPTLPWLGVLALAATAGMLVLGVRWVSRRTQ